MDEEWNDDDWFNDVCYECSGYGDDYFINDDGELECRCSDCYVMKRMNGWEDWDD